MRIVLVPGAPALLPRYASVEDPVAELRAACLAAVRWLGEVGPVTVVASGGSARVGEALLEGAGVSIRRSLVPRDRLLDQQDGSPGVLDQRGGGRDGAAYLVVGNGSACRSEKAPGHLDPRAPAFDEALGAGLRAGDLTGVDLAMGEELWADVAGIRELAGLLDGTPAEVDYDDDPFGVKYWVMRWTISAS